MPMIRRPKNLYDMLPVLLVDAYKLGHPFQTPDDLTMVYSNNTPRKSRVRGVEHLNPFGMQYYRDEYLMRQFEENFFGLKKDAVLKEYKRRVEHYIWPLKSYDHIANLHELGYLPLLVKAVPEGSRIHMRVPILTVRNTHDDFAWLTNTGETTQSNVLWLPSTSCTTAFQYLLCFEEWAEETGGSREFIQWQGHDFSYRGMAGLEAAAMSGAAHLMSFTGTDTLPAIDFLEMYYGADVETELVGGSVPATEHMVMCVSGVGNEEALIRHLATVVYPTGVFSVVSDTWDYWYVLTQVLPRLKDVIMARDGKYVTRPDSGDPVKMICGDPDSPIEHKRKGSVQVLWDIFGGTFTAKGYRTIDSHAGLIYGDSITRDLQDEVRQRLTAAGFASDNQVLGIGSYTYQHVTRDTYGNAIKATWAERKSTGGFPIFKDPITDDGMKKSASGLLYVSEDGMRLEENVSWEREAEGLLQPIFHNSKAIRTESAATIRGRIRAQVDAHLLARRGAAVPNVLVS